jgi:hypothetical protein
MFQKHFDSNKGKIRGYDIGYLGKLNKSNVF